MQKLEDYNDNLGVALLLTGQAGSGKTSLGLSLFPRTYVFVADPNFKSGVDYVKQSGHASNVVGFNYGAVDEKGNKLEPQSRYDHMWSCLSQVAKSPDVDAIFLDSALFIEDIIKAKICKATVDEAILLKGFEQWQQLILVWKGLIAQLRRTGKKIIMSAHEKREKDDLDGVWKYEIAVDGQIRGIFPAIFSDVLRCEVTETPTWVIRSIGNPRQEYLKNTFGLTKPILASEFVKIVHTKFNKPTP